MGDHSLNVEVDPKPGSIPAVYESGNAEEPVPIKTGEKVTWTVSPLTPGQTHLYVLFADPFDTCMMAGHTTDSGTISATENRGLKNHTYEYIVVVWDVARGEVYVADPSIRVGSSGTGDAIKKLNALLQEVITRLPDSHENKAIIKKLERVLRELNLDAESE
jgi:hypothetical protein